MRYRHGNGTLRCLSKQANFSTSVIVLLVAIQGVAFAGDSVENCAPACRSGYVCFEGECLLGCNPKCATNETCLDGECIVVSQPKIMDSSIRDEKKCFPSCRTGYLCVDSKCISECNPPCRDSMQCIAGECVSYSPKSTRHKDMVCVPACGEGYECAAGKCEGFGPDCKATKFGLSLTAGYGYQYSGAGASLEVMFKNRNSLIFGAGYFPASMLGGSGSPGCGVGLRLAWGDRSRFVWDLVHFGLAGKYEEYSGEYESTTLWGFTSAMGYQFVGCGGFEFTITFGATIIAIGFDEANAMFGSPVVPTMNLGLGYKLF